MDLTLLATSKTMSVASQEFPSCQIGTSFLSSMICPGMLRAKASAPAERLRQLALSVCGSFRKSQRFRKRDLYHSRHQPDRWVRHRVEASSQSRRDFRAGHLHHWERQPCRPDGCASIRMPRLSRKAVLGEVADRTARESIGEAHVGALPVTKDYLLLAAAIVIAACPPAPICGIMG